MVQRNNPFSDYEEVTASDPFSDLPISGDDPFSDLPVEPMSVIPGKEVVGIGMDLSAPFDEVVQYYPQLTDPSEPAVDPLRSYESMNDIALDWGRVFNLDFKTDLKRKTDKEQPTFEQAPPQTAWQAFKSFFESEPSYHYDRPMSRIEKFDRAFDAVIGGPLRFGLKVAKGMTWGAQDLAWAAIKRSVPEDVWTDEIMDMTLDEAMDWAAGYNPSGFQKSMGEVAEFVGRLKSVQKITNRIARPPKPGVMQKAGEAAAVFGATGATEQLQKMASQVIDPSEAEYGYEGPAAVLRDMAIGAIFSFVESGVEAIVSRLTPSEYQRALKILGLKEGATDAQINQATRDMARKYHPDKVRGMRAEFEKVMDARETLRAGQEAKIVYRGQEVTFKGRQPGVEPITPQALSPGVKQVPKITDEIVQSAERIASVTGEPAYIVYSSEVDDFIVSPERTPGARQVMPKENAPKQSTMEMAKEVRRRLRTEEKGLGPEAGQAPIVGDVAQALVSTGRKMAENSIELARSTLALVKRNATSARAYAATLGEGGRVVSEDLDDVTFQVTKKTNNDALEIRRAYRGLNKEQREMVGKAVNERLENVPGFIQDRAEILRTALDNAMNEAADLGMMRTVGEGKKIPVGGAGKAYPQVPNAEGIKFLDRANKRGVSDPSVFSWAAEQVETGKFNSVDAAVSALQAFRESRLRGMNPYLESFRVELPEEYIEWDGSKVLTRVVERNWMTVEGVRKWGDEFQGLSPTLEQIKIEYGSDAANRIKRFIQVSFGRESGASEEAQRISNIIRGYQFTSKVAVSPLTIMRNMADRIAKGLTDSPVSTLRALAEYPPFLSRFLSHAQKLEEEMLRRGAVFSHGSLSEGYEAGSNLAELLKTPFSASERGNQVFIALVRYHKLKADLAKMGAIKTTAWTHITNAVEGILGGTRRKPIESRLGNILDRVRKGETITRDDVNKFLHEAVQQRAFPMLLDTKPIWWDSSPLGRVLAQFKTWPIRQTNMIWEDVVKYTIKTGDPSRLLGFITGALLAGEIYNVARDYLTGREDSISFQLQKSPEEREIGKAILNDLLDGGVIGMMADFTYGVYDWATGVTVRSGRNTWEAVQNIKEAPDLAIESLEKLVSREISPYRQVKDIIRKIDEQRDERNITTDYLRARAKAFEWKKQKDHPGVAGKIDAWTDAALFGKPRYDIGENSLAYEMIQRSIILGDVDDAAQYVAHVIEHSDNASEAAAGLIRSAQNRSPLGPIPAKERAEFRDSMTPNEWETLLDLQNEFMDLYSEAVRLGRDLADIERN